MSNIRTPREQVLKELGKFIEITMFEREDDLLKSGAIDRKMSRSQLADMVGVSKVWISDIINGNRYPTDELLLKIANALNIDEHDVFKVARRIHPSTLEEYKKQYLGDYYLEL